MSRHDELVNEVKKYSLDLFGEEIEWKTDFPVQGSIGTVRIDLLGTNPNGKIYIVDVKTEFSSSDSTTRRDASRKVIGQLLGYAFSYMNQFKPNIGLEDTFKHLQLFVVGEPELVPFLQDVCEFLDASNVHIEYLSLDYIKLEKGEEH